MGGIDEIQTSRMESRSIKEPPRANEDTLTASTADNENVQERIKGSKYLSEAKKYHSTRGVLNLYFNPKGKGWGVR